MATTAQVEAAITRLRTARAKLGEIAALRTAAIERRARMQTSIDELNILIAERRTEVAAATTALRALLAETETGAP